MSIENILTKIPSKLQKEIIKMDSFLKSLHPLKFKKKIERSGTKINYVDSDFGISYSVTISDAASFQQFGWYYLYDRKDKKWYRKNDYFVETLNEIAKTRPSIAKRIFNAINECSICKGSPCSAISYTYDDKQKLACYGRIHLGMNNNDFDNVRIFFQHLNSFINKKVG